MTCRQTINQLRPEHTAGEILPFLPKGKELRESKVKQVQANLEAWMLTESTPIECYEIIKEIS